MELVKSLIKKFSRGSKGSEVNECMRFYNNVPVNINTGVNIFKDGSLQYDIGSPFTFQVETGTFYCNKSGVYTFSFNTLLSLGTVIQSKNKLLISDGINIRAVMLTDYNTRLPKQFSFAATLPATRGEVWAIGFQQLIDGSIVNTSGSDPTYSCPTTTLDIIRIN